MEEEKELAISPSEWSIMVFSVNYCAKYLTDDDLPYIIDKEDLIDLNEKLIKIMNQ